MKVAIGELVYSVRFKHYTYDGRRVTECNILDSTGCCCMGRDIATCSEKDPFSYTVGRKIALARSIPQIFPGYSNKPARPEFWRAYWAERAKVTKKKWVA